MSKEGRLQTANALHDSKGKTVADVQVYPRRVFFTFTDGSGVVVDAAQGGDIRAFTVKKVDLG